MKLFWLARALAAATAVYASQVPLSQSHDSSELFKLHKALVEHESITGHEANVARWLVSYLEAHHYTVETIAVNSSYPDPRYNVLAYRGSNRKSRTLVTSHIDVVPPYWPYERRADGTIWGRGSVDAKASVAAQVTAVTELYASGGIQPGDVALAYVVGEETSGDGMRTLNTLGMSWDTVIFGEPTELKLAAGHKGIVGFRLIAHGKAGHSGYPELGRSANAMMVEVLHALLNLELPYSEKFGNTTINLGKMDGGVAANVIPETATASLAIRIADGTPEDLVKIVGDVVDKYGDGHVEMERTIGGYPPVEIDADVPGFETITVNYGTDVMYLEGDHKRYLYGPGDILVAHSDHEHLREEDLKEAVRGYKALVKNSLEA